MDNPFDTALDAVLPPEKPAAKAASATGVPKAGKVKEIVQDALNSSATIQTAEAHQAKLAELQARIDAIEDGVYFGLPAEIYHAIPRLSASGLQKLCVSAGTFWRGSWLDPDRPELDEDETKAQQLGKAYHTARLEPDLFHALYVREPSKADYSDADQLLTSDAAIKAELKARELTQSIGTETVADRARRLHEDGFTGVCFPLVLAEWEEERAGRTSLPAKYFDQIITDMDRIKESGEVAEKLVGGQAEVSIFWTDEHGLKMKCRIDYLTPGWWDDFKTFDNSRGKELEQALVDAVRYNRYHVQAVSYRDGVEAVRVGGLQIKGDATDDERALIASIQMRPAELECWYVFQEKGGVPNLLAWEFPFFDVPRDTQVNEAITDDPARHARVRELTRNKTQIHGRARFEIERAKALFHLYATSYEPGRPWQPINPIGRFDDIMFNTYWLEGR